MIKINLNQKIFYFAPIIFLIFPIHPRIGLNGFPFDNKIEVLFLIFSISVFFIPKKYFYLTSRNISISIIIISLFLSLQIFKEDISHNACYYTTETPISNFEMNFNIKDICQFSFEKPFNSNSTRSDYYLNFNYPPQANRSIEYTNWNLHFFNQTGFNFYEKGLYGANNDLNIPLHWVKMDDDLKRVTYNEYLELQDKKNFSEFDYGFQNIILPLEPSRSWLSFAVNWSSDKLTVKSEEVKISYVGEVIIEVNDTKMVLEPSYAGLKEQIIFIPINSSLEIDYFYRFSGLINSIPNIPYASFSLSDTEGNQLNLYEKKLNLYIENLSLLILTLLIIYLFSTLQINKKNLFLYLLATLLLLFLVEVIPLEYLDVAEIAILFAVCFFIIYSSKFNIFYYLMPIWSLSLLSSQNININSNVLYSIGGSDPLKYESWAQQIIYFTSLQGGEDIFLYQPGYRYLLAFLRLFFGDSHLSLVIFSRFIVTTVLFLIFLDLYKKHMNKKIFLSLNFLISYILLSTYSSKLNLFSSLSEWPTWVFGLLIIYLLLTVQVNGKKIYLFSLLIGLCFLIRENQLPGLLFLILLVSYNSKRKNVFLQSSLFFSFFVFIPFIHNYIFGGKFVLNQDVFISGYYYLSPFDLIFDFSESYEQLLFQLNFLIANPLNDAVRLLSGKIFPITVIFIILQWMYVFIKNKKNLINFVYFFIPLSFLLPHIFYQVHTYFPRHIIQGYLFMIASSLLINLNINHRIK